MRRYGVKRLFRFPFRTTMDVREEIAEEFRLHLDMRTEELVSAGLSPDDARAQARREFGDAEQGARVAVKHQERLEHRRRLGRVYDDLVQDLRYTFRSLRRAPGFAFVAVVTLALGVGANTTLFSVISAVLIRPLPYPESDRLVRAWTTQPSATGLPRTAAALPDYREWRNRNRTLDELAAFHFFTYNVTGTDRPERLVATRVTASMWSVLQWRPLHGRVFTSADEKWGAHRVVVLSEPLWRRRFGGDPAVIGQSMQLNGQPFTVIGVMPAGFRFPALLTELWSPIAYPPGDNMDSRDNRFVELLGRLKPGSTTQQALADLSAIAEQLKREYPQNAAVGVDLEQWQETIVGDVRPSLLFMFGASGFVLLIACANVAHLLLARAITREQELTIRAAIGAGHGRLARQLLTEHVVFAGLGAAGGLLIAGLLIRSIPLLGPVGVPRLNDVTLDGRIVAFAAALAVATALLFGVWPARRAGVIGAAGRLGESARTIAGGRMRARTRQMLVTGEVALSLVLLIGATLLIASLQKVQQVDPGFDPQRLFTATLALPPVRYGDAERVARFMQDTVDAIAALPGIEAAASTTNLPLGGTEWSKYFGIEGRPAPPSIAQVPSVYYRQVSPSYFRTMGARLRGGRLFSDEDAAGQPLVAIITETLARRFWPDGNPIGEQIHMTLPESLTPPEAFPPGITRFPRRTVVGVVADFRQNGLEREANAEVFVPLAQTPPEFMSTQFLVVRTVDDPLQFTAAIEGVIQRADRNLPIANVRTMESRLSDSMAQRRFLMLLLTAFASVALLLAVVGLYGVMSYAVSQRRAELGVRAVLGASAGGLVRMVLAEGLRMTAIGIAIGLGFAVALSRLMTTQLFQVQAVDPLIYGGVAVVFAAVACLACGVPSFRAAHVDPVRALRQE